MKELNLEQYKNWGWLMLNDVLGKMNIDDSKHLIWKFGGVPLVPCDL